jgi:hypothetical protein
VHGLEVLIRPFSTEEIDSIVHNLPLGKSPGPYGFNTFLRRNAGNNTCLQSINESFITLVPEVDNPRKVATLDSFLC